MLPRLLSATLAILTTLLVVFLAFVFANALSGELRPHMAALQLASGSVVLTAIGYTGYLFTLWAYEGGRTGKYGW